MTATLINVPVFWVKTQCRFIYIGTGFSDDLFYLEEAGYKILETLVAIHEFTQHHVIEEWNVFRCVGKIEISDYLLRHMCPSAWNNSTSKRTFFMKIDICRKSVEKIQVS